MKNVDIMAKYSPNAELFTAPEEPFALWEMSHNIDNEDDDKVTSVNITFICQYSELN